MGLQGLPCMTCYSSQKKRLVSMNEAAPQQKRHKQDHQVSMLLPSRVFVTADKLKTRWTYQSIYSWIENLAMATEQAEMRDGSSLDPLQVGNVRLSSPFYDKMDATDDQSPAQPSCQQILPHQRRTLPHVEINDHGCRLFSSSTSPLPPINWDLSFIQKYDPFQDSYHYARQIHALAARAESQLSVILAANGRSRSTSSSQDLFCKDKRMYLSIQNRFSYTLCGILDQNPACTSPNQGERRRMLNQCYQETIDKLNFLIQSLQFDHYQQHQDSEAHCLSSSSSSIKKDFSNYMTTWLRENWTNPYPDEDGLHHMANECGVSEQVISNWLINARTRKWRPAICKAVDLNRPADMLLEDSIAIFDGTPVRPPTSAKNIQKAITTNKKVAGAATVSPTSMRMLDLWEDPRTHVRTSYDQGRTKTLKPTPTRSLTTMCGHVYSNELWQVASWVPPGSSPPRSTPQGLTSSLGVATTMSSPASALSSRASRKRTRTAWWMGGH